MYKNNFSELIKSFKSLLVDDKDSNNAQIEAKILSDQYHAYLNQSEISLIRDRKIDEILS